MNRKQGILVDKTDKKKQKTKMESSPSVYDVCRAEAEVITAFVIGLATPRHSTLRRQDDQRVQT